MNTIVFACRGVLVDRSLPMWKAIANTGRENNLGSSSLLLPTMEQEGHRQVRLYFFKPPLASYHPRLKEVTCDEVARQYELLRLRPDPYAQISHNKRYPAFADKYPNVTQMSDDKEGFHSLSFWKADRNGTRCVAVGHDFYPWQTSVWFCGVRA